MTDIKKVQSLISAPTRAGSLGGRQLRQPLGTAMPMLLSPKGFTTKLTIFIIELGQYWVRKCNNMEIRRHQLPWLLRLIESGFFAYYSFIPQHKNVCFNQKKLSHVRYEKVSLQKSEQ